MVCYLGMSKTTEPVSKPTSSKGGSKTDLPAGQAASARQAFMVAAANMSWQLAIVVLVPIVGGFKLDGVFTTTPLLTIIGFVVAIIGMAAVVWRQLQLFSPQTAASAKPKTTHKTPKGHLI